MKKMMKESTRKLLTAKLEQLINNKIGSTISNGERNRLFSDVLMMYSSELGVTTDKAEIMEIMNGYNGKFA